MTWISVIKSVNVLQTFANLLYNQFHTPPVIYYQEEHSDIPFIAEDVFKEIEGADNGVGDISRTYEAFNYSAALEDFQMNRK